ncbi:hypothetical protein PGT21_000172 [Puccinia graminis f. sp. tritici]|uniref:Uncharacterized protein n=1 Tax=Puccinia graminis f. sp. tritici TaxID=56615 RepID=A0A5B0MEY0_PUCGR|nr:hypothetical protein PGT21_000172 [Puccinia graminis f. sp. tritici]
MSPTSRPVLSRFLDIVNNHEGEKEKDIVDTEYINKVYLVIWSAFIPNTNVKPFTSDDKLDVELLAHGQLDRTIPAQSSRRPEKRDHQVWLVLPELEGRSDSSKNAALYFNLSFHRGLRFSNKNSLPRLTVSGSSNPEMRGLVVDLIELVARWSSNGLRQPAKMRSLKMHWLLVAPKVHNQNSHLLPTNQIGSTQYAPSHPQLDLK